MLQAAPFLRRTPPARHLLFPLVAHQRIISFLLANVITAKKRMGAMHVRPSSPFQLVVRVLVPQPLHHRVAQVYLAAPSTVHLGRPVRQVEFLVAMMTLS